MSRSADLAWCALSAPILFPLFGLIALAIWLEDGRPVFFRQRRLGRRRRIFTILKFRTMSHGMSHDERGGRRTRVGAWLRRTGLDETAQWLNVLRGEMNWIGPRPLTEAVVEWCLAPEQRAPEQRAAKTQCPNGGARTSYTLVRFSCVSKPPTARRPCPPSAP